MIDSVVILSPFRWQGVWQTLHYFAVHLSRMIPVVFVEPGPIWDPREREFSLMALLLNGRRFAQPTTSLHVVTPMALPLRRLESLQSLNDRLYERAIRHVCHVWAFRRPIFWVTYYAGVLRHLEALRAERYVYHCLDYFDHPEETHLARRAAVVLAVSRPLVQRLRAHNGKTFFAPNGVAMEWLAPEHTSDRVMSGAARSRKRLGFVGTLNRNVDFVLLETLARSVPGVDLEIIGSVVSELEPVQQQALASLKSLANVRLLGFRPPDELFGHIAQYDACLLPFLNNPWSSHADHLKFYQYLALGKPVVATSVPAAIRYRRLCYVADSHEAFLQGVTAALGESSSTHARARKRVAAAHDWARLVPRARALVSMALRTGPGRPMPSLTENDQDGAVASSQASAAMPHSPGLP